MRQVKTLVRKEMLDILRDKKTLVMMVVVPVLLYPLIIIGMSLAFSYMMQSQESKEHSVGYPVEYQEMVEDLQSLYPGNAEADGDKASAEDAVNAEHGKDTVEAEHGKDTADAEQEKDTADAEFGEKFAELIFVPAEAGEEDSVKEATDAWMEISRAENGAWHVTVQYTSSDETSSYTGEALADLLEAYREQLLTENLRAEGLDEEFLHPVVCEEEDLTPVSESFGMDIGGSIGMILIVTILLGAVYPAIDATAGEKERGTLETLLTLPVTNFQMILSKYISVALFACVTAVLSLLSLGGSVAFLMFGLSPELADQMGGFSLSTLLGQLPLLVVTLIVTALLITALCMCFCVFARSFKEANNYVTPVLFVVMLASMTAMLPSVKLDYRTALIPVVNVSLMVKQILAQQFDAGLVGTTILVNFGYSVVIVWILARMYNSEDILFSDGFRGMRLFQKRSEIRKGTVPGMGDLAISIAGLLLLYLYVGMAVTVRSTLAGMIVTQLIILAVPLLVVWYMKSDARSLLRLRKPSVRGCAGGVLLYLGTYLLGLFSSMIAMQLLPQSTQNVEASFAGLLEQPFPLLLLLMALMPAVGEEILFRGYLFGSLREHFTAKTGSPLRTRSADPANADARLRRERVGCVWAVLLSALVFAAFHMSLVKLPTFLLGAGFAFIVWKGGSIYVTMALHFLNNALSALVMKYPEQAGKLVPLLVKSEFTSAEMGILLVAGLGLAVAGIAVLCKRQHEVE